MTTYLGFIVIKKPHVGLSFMSLPSNMNLQNNIIKINYTEINMSCLHACIHTDTQ